MATSQPRLRRDADAQELKHGAPIQVLAPTGVSARGALTGVTDRVGPFLAGSVVSLWASIDCFFRFGDSTVTADATADCDPLTAKQREFYSLGAGNTHVAFILQSGAGPGIFHVRELV